jgi:hypothetical protein
MALRHGGRKARRPVAVLAPAYLPRRPTETVLHGLVRQHLASFIAHAREHYEGGLPRYVEAELRAYLKCGVFSEGFTRCHCDACGHDLLVAFSCKSRTVCPSCAGRRMANTAAAIVDRVLPDVAVRQYVLSLPYELRRLAAFKADVLTALGRVFVDAVFASYRRRARRQGIADGQCGAINFVQRFGSMNLNVHFHVVALDGAFTRDAEAGVQFHAAPPPAREDLEAIVRHARDRAVTWLRRHGHLDERPIEERGEDAQGPTALDACAAIAIGRGQVSTLPNVDSLPHDAGDTAPDGPVLGVDLDGFNLHAGVRIAAGDDLGRERLCRYGARPPLSLERLRRLPGGRVAYRLKYVGRGRGKHRVMSAMEFMARLAALIAPPRYPLVRYAGVLGPRSAWRKDVVPRPRERVQACDAGTTASEAEAGPGAPARADGAGRSSRRDPTKNEANDPARPERAPLTAAPPPPQPATASPDPRDVKLIAPNVLSVRHWQRLMQGALYAATPRVDWASLLRRSFEVDVLQCPRCQGRLRVVAVITEREPVRRILAHLGVPTEAPPLARARDPTDDDVDEVVSRPEQLELGLA